MGGRGAPDNLQQGYETQVWLATHEGPSGRYFYHQKEKGSNPEADDIAKQDELLAACEQLTGIKLV